MCMKKGKVKEHLKKWVPLMWAAIALYICWYAIEAFVVKSESITNIQNSLMVVCMAAVIIKIDFNVAKTNNKMWSTLMWTTILMYVMNEMMISASGELEYIHDNEWAVNLTTLLAIMFKALVIFTKDFCIPFLGLVADIFVYGVTFKVQINRPDTDSKEDAK